MVASVPNANQSDFQLSIPASNFQNDDPVLLNKVLFT